MMESREKTDDESNDNEGEEEEVEPYAEPVNMILDLK